MLLLMAVMAAQLALAADLNAPLDTRPTLGSEIHRGYEAASRCDMTLEALDYGLCIDRVSTAEQSKIRNADPFNLGLALAAWETLDVKGQSAAGLRDNPLAQAQVPEDRKQAGAEFFVVRALQRKLNLTDDQLLVAGEVGTDDVKARWRFWLSQPSAEMTRP